MSVNNEYKRYFIILQEDEKGFEFSAGKTPTGYVKIEVKNGKGKLTAFVQNVKSDERLEYRLLLVAPGKRIAVDIGKAMIDSSGRGEIYHEFESDNVLGSGLNVSDYMVAAISAGNGIPLSGYVGRDKMEWKNKYEIVNKPREVRMDKKTLPLEEVPMPQAAPVIEKHVAPVQEIVPPPVQQPVTAAEPITEAQPAHQPILEKIIPIIEKNIAPIQEIPLHIHKKEKLPVAEIPVIEEKPVEVPKVKKEIVPIQEIPIIEEIPVPAPMPEAPQFTIQPKFELNLQPNIEITHENIMMNQVSVEQSVELPVEEKEEYVAPLCQPVPECDYYYCEESDESEDSSCDSDDRPKHHGHHEHHEEHEEHHEHHSDDDNEECDEYDYNPYFCSNMYRHLRNLLRRLRRCEPFRDEDMHCEWYMVRDEIFMLNDVAVPYMGKMMPLGYPFMMEDCMMMSRKDYILGVCYDREHDHDDRKHIKHIMFGVPGMYSKVNEQYYMAKGYTRFRKHKEKAYGYWLMCLDIRNGMLKR